MSELLVKLTRAKVQDYHDKVIHEHCAAMQCLDCEELLKAGISAHKWLERIEETFREAAHENLVDFSSPEKDVIEELFRLWMRPCDAVISWIDDIKSSGHEPDNLNEFLDRYAIVEDRVQKGAWLTAVYAAQTASFASEPW